MSLELLPTRQGGAAENMATDFMMLQRYPNAAMPRFRHYGWHRPAFTFGYSQKISFVREQLPKGESFDLCRRATGGGIVDHREDWTFALVIPHGHIVEEMPARESYRMVHEVLTMALCLQKVRAATQPCVEKTADGEGVAGPAGVCFQRAEVYDVVNRDTGEKIAGAAQKRNKQGLLFQGSIWRPALGREIDWEQFYLEFTAKIGAIVGYRAVPAPWPEFNEAELSGLIEQYSGSEWMEFR